MQHPAPAHLIERDSNDPFAKSLFCFLSSRRRHTRCGRDWSSDVCSSDLADAQVGNWLSWQDLSWDVEGTKVTGPDLLNRTIFYKVGHHGSHNATLREKGLEEMKSLKLAFVPVDHAMAVKKRWNKMPLRSLMDALNEATHQCVVRIDEDVPAGLKNSVASEKLFHEVVL